MADEMPCEQCRQRGPSTSSSIKLVVYPCGRDGHFELTVSRTATVDNLKRAIAKKLNVAKERLCLLHKEKQLQDGTLSDNNIQDGNKIMLLPMVETGLLAQRPEQCVLQALESLNDSQVNDFLSGKAPLNLTMRLGDHMMFIQLQLSTASTNSTTSRRSSTIQPSKVAAAECSSSSSTTTSNCPSSSTTSTSNSTPSVALSAIDDTNNELVDDGAGKRQPSMTVPSDHTNHLLDAQTLASASRSLSHTLRRLSTHASDGDQAATNGELVTGQMPECEHRHVQCHPNGGGRAGAIIESMHHHGKGVYSGTFSGTLNPALQDRNGLPKRDISTIVHILNDLLGASPQYRRYHHHRSHQTQSSVDAVAMTLARGGSSGVRRRSDRTTSGKSAEEFSRLSQENMATRGKMEQLRVMLEERRSRRRTRRETHRWSPYGSPAWTTTTTTGNEPKFTVSSSSFAPSAMEVALDGSRQLTGQSESPSCNNNNITGCLPPPPSPPDQNSVPTTPTESSEPSSSPDNSMDCTASNSSEEYLTPNTVVA